MLVGLCGRSGSGKGYIAGLFAQRGIPSVDTDRVYREMTGPTQTISPCMTELTERFGSKILAADNALDRAVMRSLVFGTDPVCKQNLADLNAITHKHILMHTEKIAEEYLKNGADIVLIDAPVLYESGFDQKCDAVICVTAPEEVRMERIMKRDTIDRESALRRLQSQMAEDVLVQKADYVIDNDADKETLFARIDAVIEALRGGKA